MNIKKLSGAALAITLMVSPALQADTYLEEEPYANFAIDQRVESSDGDMMEMEARDTMAPKTHIFWGWEPGADSNK